MSPKTNAEPAYEKLNSLFAPAPRKPNTELPTPERRTKKPSANWSPSPQAIVLSLMARRSVEKSQASPSITAMPSTPVKRPMNTSLHTANSSANHPAHQRPLLARSFLADVITVLDAALRFGKFGVAIVMNRGQRFSLFHAIADPLVEFEPNAVIDLVFLFFAASAEHGERDAKLLAVGAGDEAAGGTRYLEMQARGGQTFRFVNDAFIAALQANPLPEFFACLAGGDHGFGQAAAFFHALRSLTEIEHPRGEVQAQVTQIGGAAAFEYLDGFGDLVRMARHAAKRLIHSGDKGYHFLAHALAGFDHDFCKANRIFLFLHERPGARLDVEDQGVNAFSKFFAHDRRADETDILDGRSNVTKRVDFLVGRSNLRGLPDQAHAAFAEDAAKCVQRQIHVEARNRFQFVERAAGVAEAAAADHRNR